MQTSKMPRSRKVACVLSSLALSTMMMPAAAFAGTAVSAQSTGTTAPSTLSVKANIAKTGSTLALEAGDQVSTTLANFKASTASSSATSVMSVKVKKGKLVLTAKKAGKATITAKRGKKSFKTYVKVGTEGAYTLENGTAKKYSVSKIKSVASSSSHVTVKKGSGAFTATAKSAGTAVATAKTTKGTSSTFVLSVHATMSADTAIESISTTGFVDIDGAKTQALVVKYSTPLKASALSGSDFKITDYALYAASQSTSAFERGAANNPGAISKVYVNSTPSVSATGGTATGNYLILEVNTNYMLSGNTPTYTQTMMGAIEQTAAIQGQFADITPTTAQKQNYTVEDQVDHRPEGDVTVKVVVTDKSLMSISGLNGYESKTFDATHCYNEQTSSYEDYSLPYAIYVPKNLKKGEKVGVVLHIHDAGTMGTDTMLTLTESQGPANYASATVQDMKKCIVVCPQIDSAHRGAADDFTTSSAVPAVWQLMDSITTKYKTNIDTDSIYGTGQSMGGMMVLAMAGQRDNYFAGILAFGSQWGNNYNKDSQGKGSLDPTTDPTDVTNPDYQNWYYSASDDNIMILNCAGDAMSTGLWQATQDYFTTTGNAIPKMTWDPNASTTYQNAMINALVANDSTLGFRWGAFEGGSHMSTWKYGHDLDASYAWLLSQSRSTENSRGKIAQLNKTHADGGTKNWNSAQYTPQGPDSSHPAGWTPAS